MPPKGKIPVDKPLVNDEADRHDVVLTHRAQERSDWLRSDHCKPGSKQATRKRTTKPTKKRRISPSKLRTTFSTDLPLLLSAHHTTFLQTNAASFGRLYQVLKTYKLSPLVRQLAFEPVSTNEVVANSEDVVTRKDTSYPLNLVELHCIYADVLLI